MDQRVRVEKLVVGTMQTNCYLYWDEETNDGVVIDPGDEGDFISEKILEWKINLKAIVLTHGHYDHVLGVLPIKLNFQAPVLLNPKDEFLYLKAGDNAQHWQGDRGDPLPKIDGVLNDGDRLTVGGNVLVALSTPGHTPGSVCLLDEVNKMCFCGDLWFKQGVGRSDFSYGRPKQLIESLTRMKRFCRGWVVYPGHEDEFIGR